MNTTTDEKEEEEKETILSSFTREEATFLRVAAAFVTIHHHRQKKRRSEPLLPSRPTTMHSMEQHIQHMIHLCQTTPVGTPRWNSLVQHLAHQLPRHDWKPSRHDVLQHEALWYALLPLNPTFFASKLVPLLHPQKHFPLLQAALLVAPLSLVETTVDEWIQLPPLLNLAAYYVQTSSGTELLSKWAQDHLLQQLLQRLDAPKRA
jgi:hypothetical protein